MRGDIRAQQMAAEQTARRVVGVPVDVELQGLVDPVELVRAQIAESAAMTMDLYSHKQNINGRKYRVSAGKEHFPSAPGILDKSMRVDGEPIGFQLVQQVSRRNQDAMPIYVIVNGDLSVRAATIQVLSKAITPGNGEITLDDPVALETLSTIVASIGADSRERVELQNLKAESKRLKTRSRVKQTVGTVLVSTLVGFGTVQGINWLNEYDARLEAEQEAEAKAQAEAQAAQEKAQAEAQAQADAEAAAEQARQDAAAEKELKKREEAVRAFDASTQIEGEIYNAQAGQVISVQPTGQFIDQTVPALGAADISEELARDISAPRAIEVTDAVEGNNCSLTQLPVNVGDSFKIASNASSSDDVVLAKFDPRTDTLTICHNGMFNGNGPSTVTEVVIQKAA